MKKTKKKGKGFYWNKCTRIPNFDKTMYEYIKKKRKKSLLKQFIGSNNRTRYKNKCGEFPEDKCIELGKQMFDQERAFMRESWPNREDEYQEHVCNYWKTKTGNNNINCNFISPCTLTNKSKNDEEKKFFENLQKMNVDSKNKDIQKSKYSNQTNIDNKSFIPQISEPKKGIPIKKMTPKTRRQRFLNTLKISNSSPRSLSQSTSSSPSPSPSLSSSLSSSPSSLPYTSLLRQSNSSKPIPANIHEYLNKMKEQNRTRKFTQSFANTPPKKEGGFLSFLGIGKGGKKVSKSKKRKKRKTR